MRARGIIAAACLVLAGCQTPGGAARQPEVGGTRPASPTLVRREGPVPSLDALRGASPRTLESLLGEPNLRRRDPGAELWQYASPECVLLLVLYPAEGGGEFTVRYLEASPGGAGEAALRACVAAAAHRPVPATS
ncbi:MAG: hypothetical protein GC199_01475 [Alphaproteobacteria bacterium]|nr:hypothetical protein [Alphaproteobacteria bacterium]